MRHAESEYNVKSFISQDPNIKVGITEKGRKQALEAGRKLRDLDFDIIFVSDFLRTQETARIVKGDRDV